MTILLVLGAVGVIVLSAGLLIGQAGFELASTFGRPHFTVTTATPDESTALLRALGEAEASPYHERRPGTR